MATTTPSKNPGRVWKNNGHPNTLPADVKAKFANDDYGLDYTNKLTYLFVAKAWVLDAENPFFKVKGDKGDPGTSSSWSTSPDDYGAVHANQTFVAAGHNQAYIDANFPGIGAVTTDQIDWAAWQMAINDATNTGKSFRAYGTYYVNRTLKIEKYYTSLSMDGSFCQLIPTVNGTWSMLERGHYYSSTSSTSLSIQNGTKTFVTATGLTLTIGSTITLWNGVYNYMKGTLTSYNSGTGSMVITVNAIHSDVNTPWATDGSVSWNTWTVFFSDFDTPTPGALYAGSSIVDDSVAMTSQKTIIKNILFNANAILPGRATLSGITFRCGYGLRIEGCSFTSINEPFHLRFCLRSFTDNNFSQDTLEPFAADMGDWVGSTNSNSQSNHTTFVNSRFYAGQSNAGFKILAASGCRVRDCIIEGDQVINGINFDALGSPNVLDFGVENTHFECNWSVLSGDASTTTNTHGTGAKTFTVATGLTNYAVGMPVKVYEDASGGAYMAGVVTSYNSGTGSLVLNITSTTGSGTHSGWHVLIPMGAINAFMRVRIPAGIVHLNGTYGQYPAILFDGEGTASTLAAKISHVPYWVPSPLGKLFRGRGTNINILLDWNDNLYADFADIATKFDTTIGTSGTIGAASTLVTFGTRGNGSGNKHSAIPLYR